MRPHYQELVRQCPQSYWVLSWLVWIDFQTQSGCNQSTFLHVSNSEVELHALVKHKWNPSAKSSRSMAHFCETCQWWLGDTAWWWPPLVSELCGATTSDCLYGEVWITCSVWFHRSFFASCALTNPNCIVLPFSKATSVILSAKVENIYCQQGFQQGCYAVAVLVLEFSPNFGVQESGHWLQLVHCTYLQL